MVFNINCQILNTPQPFWNITQKLDCIDVNKRSLLYRFRSNGFFDFQLPRFILQVAKLLMKSMCRQVFSERLFIPWRLNIPFNAARSWTIQWWGDLIPLQRNEVWPWLFEFTMLTRGSISFKTNINTNAAMPPTKQHYTSQVSLSEQCNRFSR